MRTHRVTDAGEIAADVDGAASYRERVDRSVGLRCPGQWPACDRVNGGCVSPRGAIHAVEQADDENRSAADGKRPDFRNCDAVAMTLLPAWVHPESNLPSTAVAGCFIVRGDGREASCIEGRSDQGDRAHRLSEKESRSRPAGNAIERD
jgi:hypothetical protein